MRPIDADKILQTHNTEVERIGKDWTIDDLVTAIELAPTIEHVHGRWIYHDDDMMPWVSCSKCGVCTMNKTPYCGAKMDEKK